MRAGHANHLTETCAPLALIGCSSPDTRVVASGSAQCQPLEVKSPIVAVDLARAGRGDVALPLPLGLPLPVATAEVTDRLVQTVQ